MFCYKIFAATITGTARRVKCPKHAIDANTRCMIGLHNPRLSLVIVYLAPESTEFQGHPLLRIPKITTEHHHYLNKESHVIRPICSIGIRQPGATVLSVPYFYLCVTSNASSKLLPSASTSS